MTLSEKITFCRKARGWSQEDLAEQLGVSRQSVSKWESGASVPELDKVIQLASVFGITTDALLLDALSPDSAAAPASDAAPADAAAPAEAAPPMDAAPPLREISGPEARDFIATTETASRRLAPAVAACVLSPAPLLLLLVLAGVHLVPFTEGAAVGAGVAVLLVMVAAAVAVMIRCGFALQPYEYISKETFLLSPELSALVRQRREDYHPRFVRAVTTGVTLCILGVVPLILAATMDTAETWVTELRVILSVDLLLVLVSIAVYLFVRAGMVHGCYTQLLQEEDFTPQNKRAEQTVSGPYWCLITAVYLAASFLTGRWDKTWIIWPCAGVLYGAIAAMFSARNRDDQNPR